MGQLCSCLRKDGTIRDLAIIKLGTPLLKKIREVELFGSDDHGNTNDLHGVPLPVLRQVPNRFTVVFPPGDTGTLDQRNSRDSSRRRLPAHRGLTMANAGNSHRMRNRRTLGGQAAEPAENTIRVGRECGTCKAHLSSSGVSTGGQKAAYSRNGVAPRDHHEGWHAFGHWNT